MKNIVIGFTGFLIAVLSCGRAAAWSHAGAYGGSVSHVQGVGTSATNRFGDTATHATGSGQTNFSNPYGGTATHTYGQGTTASNRYGDTATHATGSGQTNFSNSYGGSATHYAGGGTTATSAYGGTATHYAGGGWSATNTYGTTAYGNGHYYGGSYATYHPPTTVNYYGAGCYNCGGWHAAGVAAVGVTAAAAGTAVAMSAVASANTAAAASTAYSAGYVAGSTTATAYAMNAIYPVLPAGCTSPNVGGTTYFFCGNTWFQPSYGANGVYYRVVPTP